jgi:MYXO-CTERM domain-containing protein
MNRAKTSLLSLCATLSLLGASTAPAAVICAGCEYDEGAAGSFLGLFNGLTRDFATFTHTGVGSGSTFEDFWVFDVTPGVVASLSADFTVLAPILGFFGELYTDAGSVCGAATCTEVLLGALLGRADAGGAMRFELDEGLIAFLPEGRYILRIGGSPNAINQGAYSGQLAVFGFAISEAGSFGLLLVGLLALGGAALYRRRTR